MAEKRKAKKRAPAKEHPDITGLKLAGIPAARVTQLAQAHGVSHPAVPKPGSINKNGTVNGVPLPASMKDPGTGASAAPTTPGQYAADVLLEAGLPDTASNESLLESQMTVEGMPGSENNPLATTVKDQGSKSVNSAGVQEYPSLIEGSQAEAQTLKQKNMASIYDALKGGTDTAAQYAQALAGSSYEGYDPKANQAYANAFLQDAGYPATTFPGGGSGAASPSTYQASDPTLGTSALANAMSTNPYASLGSLIPGLGTQSANSSLQGALAQLGSGTAQNTLTANTTQAPGSPDQTPSQAQQTAVNPASLYQAQLAALLPQIRPANAPAA